RRKAKRDAPGLREQPNCPQADVEDERPPIRGKILQTRERGGIQARIVLDPPDPRVGVQQRRVAHFSASMSASSTTGSNGSPCHVTLPRTRSHGFESVSGAGTTRATVLPRLVIVMTSPRSRTRSR